MIVERFKAATATCQTAAERVRGDDCTAYFVKRLFEALICAEQATSIDERAIYLRISRYYQELIELLSKHRPI